MLSMRIPQKLKIQSRTEQIGQSQHSDAEIIFYSWFADLVKSLLLFLMESPDKSSLCKLYASRIQNGISQIWTTYWISISRFSRTHILTILHHNLQYHPELNSSRPRYSNFRLQPSLTNPLTKKESTSRTLARLPEKTENREAKNAVKMLVWMEWRSRDHTQKPRQYWPLRQKKSQLIKVGILLIGGAVATHYKRIRMLWAAISALKRI